jgi:hypothetical protein
MFKIGDLVTHVTAISLPDGVYRAIGVVTSIDTREFAESKT